MSEKRKDNKGRILRTGESQRKDLIYQYRYTDIRGKRQTVYSSDLKELREKEKEIQKQLDDGIDYAAGKINVIQLLERYINSRVIYNMLNDQAWNQYINQDDPVINKTMEVFQKNEAFPKKPVPATKPVYKKKQKVAMANVPYNYRSLHRSPSRLA